MKEKWEWMVRVRQHHLVDSQGHHRAIKIAVPLYSRSSERATQQRGTAVLWLRPQRSLHPQRNSEEVSEKNLCFVSSEETFLLESHHPSSLAREGEDNEFMDGGPSEQGHRILTKSL